VRSLFEIVCTTEALKNLAGDIRIIVAHAFSSTWILVIGELLAARRSEKYSSVRVKATTRTDELRFIYPEPDQWRDFLRDLSTWTNPTSALKVPDLEHSGAAIP
jgi:Fic family protein